MKKRSFIVCLLTLIVMSVAGLAQGGASRQKPPPDHVKGATFEAVMAEQAQFIAEYGPKAEKPVAEQQAPSRLAELALQLQPAAFTAPTVGNVQMPQLLPSTADWSSYRNRTTYTVRQVEIQTRIIHIDPGLSLVNLTMRGY